MKRPPSQLAKIAGLVAAVAIIALLPGCEVDASNFPWTEFFVGLFNFAIFAGIIIYFGGSYIQEFFANRRAEFLRDMEAAKEARKEAEKRLEEYDQKLDELEGERQALLDEYHAQGEREKQRIIEEAKQQVERMRADAEATIDQEVKKAKSVLEQQAVDLAIEMARDKARERIDDDAQDGLFDDYISQLDARSQ